MKKDLLSGRALELLQQRRRLSSKPMASLSASEKTQLLEVERELGKLLEPAQAAAEARQSLRVKVSENYELSLSSLGDFQKVFLKNISGGGIYVGTQKFLEVGSQSQLSLKLPGEKSPLTLQVEVAWVSPKAMPPLPAGMGLKFLNLTVDQQQKISRLRDQALENEIKADDEMLGRSKPSAGLSKTKKPDSQ